MSTYPSKECEECSLLSDRKRSISASKNKDGTYKYPVFELAGCSCFKVAPNWSLIVKGEKQL